MAYLRVSTVDQAEHGDGLDVQESAIRTWAEKNGHAVVAWASDEGISGSNGLNTRQGLLEALEAVRDGSASGVVVYRLDRLARDLIVQEQLLGELWRLGAAVFSTAEAEAVYLRPDDPDDPSRKLIRQVLGAVSEYERSMIALRLRSGRRMKSARGGYIGGFANRYGFRLVDGQYVPETDEQAVIARCVALRDTGASLRDIAATLNAEAVLGPSGGVWHAPSVQRTLARVEFKV